MNAAREYLTLVESDCEDAWVDSGTGNMAWKEDKPKKQNPRNSIPRKRILEMIDANVSLIKTIEADMFPSVIRKVEQLYNGKIDDDDFIEWCVDECNISEGRAKVIAFDQINKLKTQVKVENLKRRGFDYAVWIHGKDCHVPREYHKRKWNGKSGIRNGKPNGLDGFVFSLDDPPVIDEVTNERGFPGQKIGCCCSIKGVRM